MVGQLSSTVYAFHYQLKKLVAKLNSRERILVVVTGVLLVGGIGQGILWLTGLQDPAKMDADIARTQTEIKVTEKAIVEITQRENDPKIRQLRSQKAQLESNYALLEERIQLATDFLIPPQKMAQLLEQLLARYQGLKLLNLETLPPKVVQSPVSDARIYSHGLKLTLTGQYNAMAKWLNDIEQLDWVINWDHLNYRTTKWPQGAMELEIHTLSQHEAWIGV